LRVIVKPELIVLASEGEDAAAQLAALRAFSGDVFRLEDQGDGVRLTRLGPEADACAHPINITARSPAPLDLISNFAATPFSLDERPYASVEGFWQALKVADVAEQVRIAALHGYAAKHALADATWPAEILYDGQPVRTGTSAHWALMKRAVRAKFEQHAEAREALLSTGKRPLTHRVRRDSETIPGVVMAEIWMAVRRSLAQT
jgi:predicted NAD-dependent protein-ADP-ribosyltransferase YbiA (DUF1768 family)